jgi:UrcA family protein
MRKSHHPIAIGSPLAALAAIALLPFAASATASDITGRDITVRYADLDAGTIEGATVLLQRIQEAAGRVCAPLDHGDLASRNRRLACEQKLTAAAVTGVDSPTLASLYQSARRDPPRVIALAR